MVWWIWKWRNFLVFSNEHYTLHHKLIFIQNQWRDMRTTIVKRAIKAQLSLEASESLIK